MSMPQTAATGMSADMNWRHGYLRITYKRNSHARPDDNNFPAVRVSLHHNPVGTAS